MDEQLLENNSNSLVAGDIWVNFSRPVPVLTMPVIPSSPVIGVEVVITQMEDMEVSPQTLELTPPPIFTKGIFILEEGPELPFLPIPSPSNLSTWSQDFPAAANTQGGVSLSGEGPSNLGIPHSIQHSNQWALPLLQAAS